MKCSYFHRIVNAFIFIFHSIGATGGEGNFPGFFQPFRQFVKWLFLYLGQKRHVAKGYNVSYVYYHKYKILEYVLVDKDRTVL